MKALKIAASVAACFLLIAVAAVIAGSVMLDKNRLVAELAQVVKEKKQRTLKVEGDIALSLFPKLGVKLGKVSLSEHGSEAPFAALDSARVSVALLPLLKKTLVVDRIELSGVNATLVRHKDGSLNIADLLAPSTEPSPLLKFDIAGVRISDSRLGWRDEASGQSLLLSGFELSADRLSDAAQGSLKLATDIRGEQPRLDAKLELAGSYDYDISKSRFGVDKLDVTLKGALPGVPQLELGGGADHLLASQATGELQLDGLMLSAKGRRADGDFVAMLKAPQLVLNRDKASGKTLDFDAKLSSAAHTLTAKLSVSGIDGTASLVRAAQLAIDVETKSGDTSVKASLQSPLQADVQARSVELRQLAGSVDLVNPAMPTKQLKLPISGRLHADLARQTAAGTLTTRFDESQGQLSFDVARFTPLSLGFGLDIDRLNLDRYLPPPQQGAANKASTPAPVAEQVIDLSALKSLNLNGRAHIGSLQIRNIKAQNVRFDLRAAGGRLDIAPHSASLYDGTLTGGLSIDANGNAIGLKEELSNVSIAPMLKDAANKDLLEGRGNVALDLKTRGATANALKKSLSGTAHVALRDGAIHGINLAQALRLAQAQMSGGKDALQQARASEKTDFSELSASFNIANGVAHNTDLAVKSPFLRLAGAGDLDLANARMDYLAKASVVGSSAGQGGKELEALKGLTVPVRITGPFDALAYRLEVGSLVQDAAKAKAEDARRELQQKAEDKIKQQLKGLFGK